MVAEYVPSDHRNDDFYERFMEQRARDLNNPSTTEEHDFFPFPIEPLRSISSTNKPKRSSMHSNDSGITSLLASSRTPVLSLAIPIETSSPHPSPSHHIPSHHNLLNCRPGNISVRWIFVTVPPALLEIALNRAPKSLKRIAHSQITPILSQY